MKLLQEPVLDEWVISELAPLLAAEITEMRSASGRDADTQALAEVERKLTEARAKEAKCLADYIGVFDKEQLEAVAIQLRGERERLQRRTEELRARLKSSDIFAPDISVDDLASMPKAAVKDALRRVIQWIAVGSEGLTVLTSWGTYIGATFSEVPRGTYLTAETKRGINSVSPAACLRCPTWLPSRQDFTKGRRDSMGKRSERLPDDEILPGIGEPAVEPMDDLELTIEIIDLNS